MSTARLRRPDPSEYNAHYEDYVGKIDDADIIAVLRTQRESTLELFAKLPAAKLEYRYAPGKWTLREVLGHVVDMEWVFTARAFHFARAVPGDLPGVEQDDVMKVVDFAAQPWPSLLDQYRHLRTAGIEFFAHLDDQAWGRKGIASGNPVTVRALAYIIAGHDRHHMDVVRQRYL